MIDKHLLRKLWIFCLYRISKRDVSLQDSEKWVYSFKSRLPWIKQVTGFCSFEIPQGDRKATIHDIRIGEQFSNKGFGSYLLGEVLAYIDRFDKSMQISVDPIPGRLNKESLKRWYERHGFIRGRGDSMFRPKMSDRRAKLSQRK